MIWHSLKFRLFAAATICVLGALVLYWSVLTHVFEQHVSERLYKELEAHLNQLTTLLEVTSDGGIRVSDNLDNPRFARPFGGLYWQVKSEAGAVMASRSLWDQAIELPPTGVRPGVISRHRGIKSNSGTLIAIERTVLLKTGGRDQPVQLVLAMDQKDLDLAKASFDADVAILVAMLALFLLAAAAVQILVGLRPMGMLRQRLGAMAARKSDTLDGRFPSEVQPLVEELNSLLEERAAMVVRARASAADLAHGLKTPLAVLSAESRALSQLGHPDAAKEIDQQVNVMNRHIERQLARARARGQGRLMDQGTELKPALEKLIRAFRQLPRGDDINWIQSVDTGLFANIDPMDFEEVAGNILDNARKWTNDEVSISAELAGSEVKLSIRDNGCGVASSDMPRILERGSRIDESVPGAGLGLAIVQDILDIYQARLRFEDVEPQGLCVQIYLPAYTGQP